jgi:hypothetical protein
MEEKDTENPIQNLLEILYNESLYRVKWLHWVTVDSVIWLLALYKHCTGYVRRVTHDEIADAVG